MDSSSTGGSSKFSSQFTIEPLNFPAPPVYRQYDPLSRAQVHQQYLVYPATASPKTSPVLSTRKIATKSPPARPFQRLSERLDHLSSLQSDSSTRRLSQHVDTRVNSSRQLNHDYRAGSFDSFISPKHPMSFHVKDGQEESMTGSASKSPKDSHDDLWVRSPQIVQSRGSKGTGVDLETGASHMVRLTPVGHTYVQYAVRNQPYVSHVSEVVTSREEVAKLRAAAEQGAAWARDNAALREQVRALQAGLSNAKSDNESSCKDSDFVDGTGDLQSSGHGMRNADGIRSERSQYQGVGSADGTRGVHSSQQHTSEGSGHIDFYDLNQREAAVFALSHDELAQRYLELWKNNNRLRLRLAAAIEGVYDNRAENSDGSKGFSGGSNPTIMTTLAVLEARVTELEDDNNALIGGAFGSADKLRSQLGQELLEAWHRSGGGSGDNMTRGILLDGLVEKMGKPSPSLAAKLGPLDDWLAESHGDHFSIIRGIGGSKVLLKPPGIQHFRSALKTSMTRQRLIGGHGSASSIQGTDNTTGEMRAKKPIQFDAITQTDNGEIVFDVEAFEMEQEAGVKEDIDQELKSSRDQHMENYGSNDTATSSSVENDNLATGSSTDGASTESSKKKLNRRSSSALKGKKASKMLSVSESNGKSGALYEEDGESDDNGYEDMNNEDAARRSHAENDLPMSHPYLHSLHPKGPPPKQWTFEDVVSGAMQKTKTTWGKLQSMVKTGDWREPFVRGGYSRGKPGCVHSDPLAARKTSLKRLSAKQSCLVKYDRWAKDDERRVYTLRQTLYLCYDLLEKKAIQEAALEKQNKVPELGHTTLPDFFEDYFFRRHGVGKLAKAELRRFVHSLKHFRNADRRAELFGLLVGLIRPELFSTALGDVFMTLIKRLFSDQLDNICNQLNRYDSRTKLSNFFVPLQSAIAAVIGQPDEFGGTIGQRLKPATWDNPVLLALSQDGLLNDEGTQPRDKISSRAAGIKREVLDAFDSLSKSGGPQKATDIDDVLFLVLDYFLGQAIEAQRALREAFYTLDENGSNTLSWDEFNALSAHVGLHYHRNGVQEPFTEEELLAVFKAANDLETDGDEDNLEDPVIMSIACYQAGMYHPNSTRTGHTQDVGFETASDASTAAITQQGECGNEFLPDTIFCRRCGTRRPSAPASS